MAEISLIPKKQKERALPRATSFQGPKIKLNSWSKIGITLVVISILASAGFFVWARSLNIEKDFLQEQFISIKLERDVSLEKDIIETNTLLSSFEGLLINHRSWSKLFKIIEKKTVPGITYSAFDGNYETGNFSIEGISVNYNLLAQQVKLFDQEADIDTVHLSDVRLNKKGEIEFIIRADFKKDIVKETLSL